MIRIGFCAMLLLATAPCQTRQAPRPDLDMGALEAVYGTKNWQAGDLMAGVDLGRWSGPAGTRGEIEVLVGIRSRSDPALPSVSIGPVRSRYREAGADGRPSLLVDTMVYDDVQARSGLPAAQRKLVDWLSAFAAVPEPLERKSAAAGEAEWMVGDVAFASPATDPLSAYSIMFVRGNVAVRLRNLSDRPDPRAWLLDLAQSLDRAIETGRPRRPDEPEISLGESGDAKEVEAGQALALGLKKLDERSVVTWRVGGPGHGYVVQKQEGRWDLRTTGPGQIALTVVVTNAFGLSATSTVVVQVKSRPR